MNDSLIILLIIFISSGFGLYLGMLIVKLKNKSEQSALQERQNQMNQTIDNLKKNLDKIENEREDIRQEKDSLNLKLIKKNTEYENLEKLNLERENELQKRQEQLRKDFEILATKILDEKSEKFTLQNKENIKQILIPLQERIQVFEKKVENSQKKVFLCTLL